MGVIASAAGGRAFDLLGPRATVLLGGTLCTLGYSTLYLCIIAGDALDTGAKTFLAALGSLFAGYASVSLLDNIVSMTCSLSFPQDRAGVVGFLKVRARARTEGWGEGVGGRGGVIRRAGGSRACGARRRQRQGYITSDVAHALRLSRLSTCAHARNGRLPALPPAQAALATSSALWALVWVHIFQDGPGLAMFVARIASASLCLVMLALPSLVVLPEVRACVYSRARKR